MGGYYGNPWLHQSDINKIHSEEKLHSDIQDQISQRQAILDKLPSLQGGERDQAEKSLTDIAHNLIELYHPEKSPGAIAKFGHLLTDHLKITDPEKRADKQRAQSGQRWNEALATAKGWENAAPLSPEQQAQVETAAQNTLRDANLQWLKQHNAPQEVLDSYIQSVAGGPLSKPPTESSKLRADFADYQKLHPEYKGTFEQWKTEQSAIGRASAPKPETLDNQYKAILVKEQSGQLLTPDEQAHKAAWQIYNRETKIDPGVARAAAFGAMRYVPVLDPTNPENVVMMRAGDASKSGANTPASIGFKTDAAITKYMTSGQGATNINYFNTATSHLELLREVGDDLQNGNIQALNALSNRYVTAIGGEVPTEFDAVKSAVAGELSKTFKGTGATDQEVAEINTTINNAQSPDQINGAINYYLRLMGGKLDALKGQYESGKSGKPNFPTGIPNPTGGTGKSKGSRSLAAAMALPVNKGKTAAQVEQHIKDHGYTVTRP